MILMTCICLLGRLCYGRAPHPYDIQGGAKQGPMGAFTVLALAGGVSPVALPYGQDSILCLSVLDSLMSYSLLQVCFSYRLTFPFVS